MNVKQYWWIVGLMILALLVSGCQAVGISLAAGDDEDVLTASGTVRAAEYGICHIYL